MVQPEKLPEDLFSAIRDGTKSLEFYYPGAGLSREEVENLPKEVHDLRKLALDETTWPLINSDHELLSKVAPAFFSICEFDMRRDEDLLYLWRLRSLGVKVSVSFLHKAEHIEPVIVHLTHVKETRASDKGLREALMFIHENLTS